MTCRLCGYELIATPALELIGMPSSAQGFIETPDKAGDLIDLSIRQCSACGLVQLDAVPVDYYRSVITSANWSQEMLTFRRSQARNFVNRFGLQNKKVIEIGCATGHFLDLLKEAGATAEGLEYSQISVNEGKRNGRNIVQGYITESPPLHPPYTAAICINFLEHAPYPLHFLKGIHSILAEEGIALIEVPSLDKVVHHQRFYDFVLDHLSYFSTSSLNHALEASGFEVLSIEKVWHDDDLCAIVRKRPHADFSTWVNNNPVVRKFEQLVASRPASRYAIWGASHQALSLIALSQPKAIEFIIDSSPAKQGLYEPTLGLPVVAPSELNESNVDFVIIMAAGYSDEVNKQLREILQFSGTVAILRETDFEIIPPTSDFMDNL